MGVCLVIQRGKGYDAAIQAVTRLVYLFCVAVKYLKV